MTRQHKSVAEARATQHSQGISEYLWVCSRQRLLSQQRIGGQDILASLHGTHGH